MTYAIKQEAAAAKVLLENIQDVVADDDQARTDAIEGETSLLEAITVGFDLLAEAEMMADAISERIGEMQNRRRRIENRAEMIRAAIASAMSETGLKKLSLPEATLSIAPTPPTAQVVEESDIPSDFWKPQPPKLDKRALLAALKNGDVSGARLSNGGTTLKVRRS